MKTSEVLRKAGDVLRERGWCQGASRNAAGAYCAYGAIWAAEPDTSAYGIATNTLRPLVDGMVSVWNDTPGRTAAEVMVAMDAAYVVALQEEDIEPADVL